MGSGLEQMAFRTWLLWYITGGGIPGMTRVAFITDSAACLPPHLAEEHSIDVVPLTLVLEGKAYRDQTDDSHRFYQHLRSARRLPTTASPPPGDYLEILRRAAGKAEAALCITVGSRFSSSYESAVQAAARARIELPNLQVKVIDSGAATMAQGFMVLEAARVAAAGGDLDAAASRAEALKPRVGIIALLDTLDYLARGGRVPRAAAWASSLLQVKPILEFSHGTVRLIRRVRVRRRAQERLYALLEERAAGARSLHLCVHHADAPEEAQALFEQARSTLRPAELYMSEFTRVMTAHTGPGLLGFAYYCNP
jgi:DegV family protein with EDD domain